MKKLLFLPPVSFALEMADLYGRVGVSRSAAALSYFLILTLFPLLVCVNYFIGLFHLNLEHFLASLDQLYEREVVHPFRRLAASVILSLLFLLTVYLSVVVIFTGDWFFTLLQSHLPAYLTRLLPLDALSRLWVWLRYLLLFCFVMLLVLIVYRTGTPRGEVRRAVVLLSSLVASLAIVAASVLFSWFIGLSSRYALVYGSLASLIILLVWLYLCCNILLLGAVMGRVISLRMLGKTG